MRIAFQADANLDPDIGRGLRRREPEIDFRGHAGVIPDGASDLDVLRIAADAGRVVVSRDVRTMLVHFRAFLAADESPDLILVPSQRSTSATIEGLLLVWLHWTPAQIRNQALWLPNTF